MKQFKLIPMIQHNPKKTRDSDLVDSKNQSYARH